MPVATAELAIALLAVWLLAVRLGHKALSPYLLLVFFALIGAVQATVVLQPPDSPIDISRLAHERREVSLVGLLTRAPSLNQERTSLLMAVDELIDGQGRHLTSGLIQLTVPGPPPDDLLPGDLLIARATIGPVASYGVPGAFNYQEYLAYQGIRASGWIRSPALIREVNRLPAPSGWERLRFLPETIRYRLSRMLIANLPAPMAGVYQAILLGEQGNLSAKVTEDFKASGSFHILSISGLHMGLIALCVTLLFSWLLKRCPWLLLHLPATKVAALLSLLPLTAYALVAGANPPVIRSLVMVAVFIAALLVDRQWSIMSNIAIAALLLLASNPTLLFTASFQLTFAAVVAIALFAPTISLLLTPNPNAPSDPRLIVRLGQRLGQWGLASLLVSVAASLGTAPILACQFNRISLVSPLSTLLIEPFLCLWTLIIGLAACLLTGLPGLSLILFKLGGLGITVSLAIADYCARLPWSSIWVPTPTVPVIVAWYGGLLLLVFWRRLSKRVAFTGTITCLGLFATSLIPVAPKSTAELTVIDVGQGSAMVIETPNHNVILIDGGRKQSPSATEFDVGENLIAPFLWHQGVTRLAMVVCTHPDADHYNGIPFIIRQFRPKQLWVNGFESAEHAYDRMLAVARGQGVAIQIPTAGATLYQEGDLTLTTLTGQTPTAASDLMDHPIIGSNNQSLVLRLDHGQVSFLLPSDIEGQTEHELLALDRLRADVLVAPHHGSVTSSTPEFVAAVAPRYVAISAGQNQGGHFPAPEVVARYRDLGTPLLNTADHGCLFFHSDGRALRVDTYR